MDNANDIAPDGVAATSSTAVTIPLSQDVADSFKKSPLVMRIIFYSYLVLLFGGVALLTFAHPENAQQYRFYGILAFVATFHLRIVLKKLFLGRAAGSVSNDLTSRLGQSEAFRKVVYDTLVQAPWSKHRLNKGRYKEPRFEDIMVLFRDGSHTDLSLARDFSSVSIVPPSTLVPAS